MGQCEMNNITTGIIIMTERDFQIVKLIYNMSLRDVLYIQLRSAIEEGKNNGSPQLSYIQHNRGVRIQLQHTWECG